LRRLPLPVISQLPLPPPPPDCLAMQLVRKISQKDSSSSLKRTRPEMLGIINYGTKKHTTISHNEVHFITTVISWRTRILVPLAASGRHGWSLGCPSPALNHKASRSHSLYHHTRNRASRVRVLDSQLATRLDPVGMQSGSEDLGPSIQWSQSLVHPCSSHVCCPPAGQRPPSARGSRVRAVGPLNRS